MKKLIVLFLVGTVVLLSGGAFIAYQFVNSAPSGSGKDVIFEVHPGSSLQVIHQLEEKKLITNSLYFRILSRVSGLGSKVQVGEYLLRDNMTPMQILQILASGKSIEHPLTVVEGWNMFEIADAVEAKHLGTRAEFLKLCRDKNFVKELLGEELPSLEGYLFPETYRVTKYTGLKKIITLMVKNFLGEYTRILEKHPHLTMKRHEHVTLASMIEKETGAKEERPMISSVFHNRLQKKMKLQSDPTTIYGIWEQSGEWNGNITRDNLHTYTKYNTYTVDALPYGPIANPGAEALLAAVNPAESRFIFFVSKNNGTHVFSETLQQHNSAVRDYQIKKSAREGHSWRELKEKKK